jgi:hypothetical protein
MNAIKELVRRYHVLRLRIKLGVLEAQGEHAEELIADHKRRYEILCAEHGKVLRRIQALQSPETLLTQALRRVA